MTDVCTHLDTIQVTSSQNVPGLRDCLRIGGWWVHLRLCLTCGHIGCCDSSPNRHATTRPVVPARSSARSSRVEDWCWCYVDEIIPSRTRRGAAMRALPELALEPWEPTKDTLHLWAQIVGKVRLATTPPQNHWWNAPLYVDARGLTTRRLRSEDDDFDISFDFVAHELVVRTSRGEVDSFPLADGLSLRPSTNASSRCSPVLGSRWRPRPSRSGSGDHALRRGHRARFVRSRGGGALLAGPSLDRLDAAGIRGWFCGKTSPVHLFWHGLDLAVTRFSGTRAPAMPKADAVTREAYSR